MATQRLDFASMEEYRSWCAKEWHRIDDLLWKFRTEPLNSDEMAEVKKMGWHILNQPPSPDAPHWISRNESEARQEFNQLLLHQYMMKVALLTGNPHQQI